MPFGQLASAVNALNGNLAAGWDAFTGNSGQSFSIPDGIVLDYQEVGLLGITDYSNQANNATHYSGRGVTMDAATNTITYPTGYGSAERTATVWMRVGTLGARTLNGVSGTFTFTPTATGAWEQLSSTATVLGNLSWTAGSDCDIADLQIGTAHWSHADWSDPTASGLNGKVIADVGPDDFHGFCTGCNGFTEEATIPQTGNRNWNKYRWFNGANTSLDYGSPLFPATADFDETFYWYITESSAPATNLYAMEQATSAANFFGVSLTSGGRIALVGGSGTAGDRIFTSANPYYQTLVKVRITKTSGTLEMYINDASIGTYATPYSLQQVNTQWGRSSFLSGGRRITGLVYGDSVSGTESGTFTRQLALASDANEQVDAYGTTILEPRLNNQTFNGFGDGEKWTTPDATSLDAVKTFIGFVFYDGINDTTWLDLTAADTIIINASSGALASSGITSPTYYTNGAAGTALNTGWNHIMLTTETAVNCGPIDGENRNGSMQFYTDVKLAAFALEKYNFNKSNYNP